jgi:hypothetical protein
VFGPDGPFGPTVRAGLSGPDIVRSKRQQYQTMFENFDQKTNQLFNIPSTVVKTEEEARLGLARSIL